MVYLPDPELTRFRVIAGVDHSIHAVDGIAALERAIRGRAVDAVIIDPLSPGLTDVTALAPVLARHPAVPVVIYASLSAEAVRRTLTLAGIGFRNVVLRGYEDQPAAFRAAIESARANSLTEQVIDRLEPSLARLPPALATAIRLAFRAPHRARNAIGLARLARMPERTCSGALARAGLASARSIVCAAHVLRAYHDLRGGDDRVSDVAARLGYRNPSALVHSTLRLTRRRPTDLARNVGPELLVTEIVDWITRRAAPARPPAPGSATSRPATP